MHGSKVIAGPHRSAGEKFSCGDGGAEHGEVGTCLLGDTVKVGVELTVETFAWGGAIW